MTKKGFTLEDLARLGYRPMLVMGNKYVIVGKDRRRLLLKNEDEERKDLYIITHSYKSRANYLRYL